jgi:hypothetical protein
MKGKTYFFGWTNIKWIIKELIKVGSNVTSFFSKKRLESGIAFLIGQWGMVYFLLAKYQHLDMTELLMWAGVEFTISGYILHQIQREKKRVEEEDQPK